MTGVPTKILAGFPSHLTPREGQARTLETLEREWNSADVFCVDMPVGCHAADQGILMYDGTIRSVQSIQVGDRLMGPDSTFRTVLSLHHGWDEMVEIVPTKGDSFTVNKGHVLSVELTPNGKPYRPQRGVINLSVGDWLASSKDFRHNHKLYRRGVDWGRVDLPVDPYVFGVWLGDGSTGKADVTTMDDQIRLAWEAWAASFPGTEMKQHHKANNRASTFCIRSVDGKRGGNPAKAALKATGALHYKHVPQTYLSSSRSQRLALLAGLLDTDGALSRGGFDFIQKRRHLSEQTCFLARSLGLAAYMKECRKSCQTGATGTYWRVSISGDCAFIPTRLAHKRAPVRLQKKSVLRTGFTATLKGRGEYFGFTVDKDHLYLLGDFTVTHNSGKSAVAVSIARWVSKALKLRSLITTPNNLLVEQYLKDYPRLATLGSKESYRCVVSTSDTAVSCKGRSDALGGCCKKADGVECPYTRANRVIRAVPYGIVNNWTYLAHRLYPDVLIADEAHNLLGMLRDLQSKRLWRREYQYPQNLRTYKDLLTWVKEAVEEKPNDAKLRLLKADLLNPESRYLVEQAVEPYRGHEQQCLKLLPIDTRDAPPLLWPTGRVKKVVLLSATLGGKDLEQLGLSKRRARRVETPSPIPPANRPIVVAEPGWDVSHDSSAEDLASLVAELSRLAEVHKTERGVIHCTYGLLERLQPLLASCSAFDGRLVTHGKADKAGQYQEWLDKSGPAVLLCAGFAEGIDLPGDLGRWQVLTKVAWSNLGEPAYQWMAETDPDRYGWEALKTVMQASGRICRGPEDRGVTYVLDRSFDKLPLELAPRWFIDGLTAGEKT